MTIDKIADWFSIVAGSMTILGLSGVVSWGIGKHFSNAIANKVYQISLSVFKLGLSFLLLFIIFFIWKFFYGEMIIFSKDTWANGTFYWDTNYPIPHLVCYAVTIPIFSFLYVICALCIVMGSLSPFKSIPQKWRNKNIELDIKKKKVIQILKAEYGSGSTFVDVKNRLEQYIFNDRIDFKVTNKIFGFDPTPGIKKTLIIIVKTQNIEKQFEFKEGSIAQIIADNIKP